MRTTKIESLYVSWRKRKIKEKNRRRIKKAKLKIIKALEEKRRLHPESFDTQLACKMLIDRIGAS